MRVLIAPLSIKELPLERLKQAIAAQGDVQDVVVASNEQAAKQLLQGPVDLVIACVGYGAFDKELESLQRLRGMTDAPIFAVGPATEAKLILRSVQNGADVFLDQNDFEAEFINAIRRGHVNSKKSVQQGRLLAFLSASGGCGASTLAVNVAAGLAKDHGMCSLIDLNPGRGDLPSLLDLKPQFTLADVCQNETRLDRPMFERMLERHESGIRLLASPIHFDDARSLSMRGICQALTFARELFTHVIADMEDCFHEEQLAVLKQANAVIIVCRLDFTSMRHGRRMLDYLADAGVNRSRLKPVVNFHGQPGEMSLDEAQEALGMPAEHVIPYDPKTISTANNMGRPAIVQSPHAKVCNAIADLAKIKTSVGTTSGVMPKLRKLWKAIG